MLSGTPLLDLVKSVGDGERSDVQIVGSEGDTDAALREAIVELAWIPVTHHLGNRCNGRTLTNKRLMEIRYTREKMAFSFTHLK